MARRGPGPLEHLGGQVGGVATDQQHGVEAAATRGGQMGEAHRAGDAHVTEGVGLQLLRQPAPPFAEAEARAVVLQRLGPLLQQLQQLLPGGVA